MHLLLPCSPHPAKLPPPNLGPSRPDGVLDTPLARFLTTPTGPGRPPPRSRPPRRGPGCPQPVPAACPHRAALKVVVEGLVQQVLLAAARRAHEAEVDVVVGASEPLAAGGHGDRVGGHGGGL